ncbi:MAG: porin [Isosphaeraceae bacterium]
MTTGDEDVGESAGGSAAVAGPSAPPPSSRFDMPAAPVSIPAKARFGPGFEIKTEDDEYTFQFHNLTQIDYRGYWDSPNAADGGLYHSTFGLPRQWWIFSGHLTKPFEYFLAPAFGFDGLNLLDAFLNIHYDDRLQFKIGRFKTPFTYEFYNVPTNALITPEWSLFFNNYGLNRDVGAMAWGQLFKKKFDYAVGLFNGSRNFFIDRNNTPDVVASLDGRPFGDREGSALENFHLGGSLDFGNQYQAVVPQVLRTNVATTGSSFFGVPFLAFNNNVIESGDRALWDVHTAWYYKQISAIAEYAGGFQDYATTAAPFNRSHIPIQSFYAQLGYFLTGETVSARGMIKPLRDFDVRPGKRGLGAIELAGRYNHLDVGQQVFTNGLADRNLWSNRVWLLDVGVNWYLTQYVKLYFGWQHAEFGDPVSFGPGRFQLTNDMLWSRLQIYF